MEFTEELAVEKATPYLKRMCLRRWCNLEFEDRLAETQFVFVSALRTFPTNSGHFLEDFYSVVVPYMDELNQRTPSRRYGFSLDGGLQTRFGADDYSAYRFIAARDRSESYLYVKMFIESLPERQQKVMWALLSGESKAEIARSHDMTVYQLKVLLAKIGKQYLTEYGSN